MGCKMIKIILYGLPTNALSDNVALRILTTCEQTEKLIQLAVSLPDNSDNQSKLTGGLIGQLWDSMQHPPLTYLGDSHKYRTADGSNNVSEL
jgi:hypothetical protein